MRQFAVIQHLGIAFLILAVSYVAFTLLPGILPHPEDFSPWPYFVATIVLLTLCLRNRKQPHAWVYWVIFVLCTLAFLDESGYGAEIFGWPPLYLPQYHIYIHDLHNLINLATELTLIRLQELQWNGGLFQNLVLVDAGILLLGAAFVWAVKLSGKKKSEAMWQARILKYASWAIAFIGLAAVGFLFSLPSDAKNAILFGHSLPRLASALVIAALSLIPFFFLRKGLVSQISHWANKRNNLRELAAILVVLSFLGIIYQCYVPRIFLPDEQVLFARVTPIILWAMAEVFILWLAVLLWAGRLREPAQDKLVRLQEFITNEPSVIYAGFALLLIILAQLIDIDVIKLNEWVKTPNFHVQLWGLWTEETFEMVASFEFLIAGLVFPVGLFKKRASTSKKKKRV